MVAVNNKLSDILSFVVVGAATGAVEHYVCRDGNLQGSMIFFAGVGVALGLFEQALQSSTPIPTPANPPPEIP